MRGVWIGLGWVLGLGGCSGPADPPPAPGLDPIRIGWQTTWATQGQLSLVLQRTDILARHGFVGEFVGFSYGGPLNEGALAGEVDVLFTADQPAISLAAKSPRWGTIGRLMYNRVGTFVPPGSSVRTPGDLRGGTVAIPFGAAAHRETLGALERAGLQPGTDVRPVNLGLQEIVALVGAGASEGRWGSIDAASAWDPAFAELEHSGAVRTIASGVVTSLVMFDAEYSAQHPGAEQRFMGAMAMASDWYRTHPDQANTWFKEAAKLPFDVAVLDLAASVEPNLQATEAAGIRHALGEKDLAGLQRAADFMLGAGLLKAPFATAEMVRPVARTEPVSVDSAPVEVRAP